MSDKELIIALKEQVSELLVRVLALERRNTELEKENVALRKLEKENIELKAELTWYKSKRNSGNSHLPPSSNLSGGSAMKRREKKSSRSPGGQMGHKANWLEQTDHPDNVVIHDVKTCEVCGEDLSHQEGEVLRKGQIFDIPRIEYR